MFHFVKQPLVRTLSKIIRTQSSHGYPFSSSSSDHNQISHKFNYGQAGEMSFNLTKRTYRLNFQTIWDDYAQLSYSGLTGQRSFGITESEKLVKVEDAELETNDNQFVKMDVQIPEDYTFNGKINGSVKHIKNNVSSKLRSKSFAIEIQGYKNVYQWGSVTCEDANITNLHGDINISSMTINNCNLKAEKIDLTKLLFSNTVKLSASKHLHVRSVVAYSEAKSYIENSPEVQIDSLSGKCNIKGVGELRISRLLSSENGFDIECDTVKKEIVIDSGSGTIICHRENLQSAKQKIKIGKMHRGTIQFEDNGGSILITVTKPSFK